MWKNYLTIVSVLLLAFFAWTYFFAEEEIDPEKGFKKAVENTFQVSSFRSDINTSFKYGDISPVEGVFSGVMDIDLEKERVKGEYAVNYFSKGTSFDLRVNMIKEEDDLYINVVTVPFWGAVKEEVKRVENKWIKIEEKEDLGKIFKEGEGVAEIISEKDMTEIFLGFRDYLEMEEYKGREMIRGMELHAYNALFKEEKVSVWVDRNYFIREVVWQGEVVLEELDSISQKGIISKKTTVSLSSFNQDFSINSPEKFLTSKEAEIEMLSELERRAIDEEIVEHFNKIKENINYYRNTEGSYENHEESEDWNWIKERVPECSSTYKDYGEYRIEISSNGDDYATWAALCSRDKDYYCIDSQGFQGHVEEEPTSYYCKIEEI